MERWNQDTPLDYLQLMDKRITVTIYRDGEVVKTVIGRVKMITEVLQGVELRIREDHISVKPGEDYLTNVKLYGADVERVLFTIYSDLP